MERRARSGTRRRIETSTRRNFAAIWGSRVIVDAFVRRLRASAGHAVGVAGARAVARLEELKREAQTLAQRLDDSVRAARVKLQDVTREAGAPEPPAKHCWQENKDKYERCRYGECTCSCKACTEVKES